MAMKLVKFARGGVACQIGKDEKSGKWYGLTSAVQAFVKRAGINPGDDVNFDVGTETDEKGNPVIVKIQKKGAYSKPAQESDAATNDPYASQSAPATTTTTQNTNTGGRSWGKTPEEQERIKRMSVVSSVATTLTAMHGAIDPNNVQDVAKTLFDFYLDLVNG